jgi:predicted permease
VVESLVRDLRYGFRILRRSPAFAATAIVTLGLGIGVNTAIFSVVDAVLWRGLPYPDATSLVLLRDRVGKDGVGAVAYPNFLDWRALSQSFEDLGAWGGADVVVSGGARTEPVSAEEVTPSYFRVLGLTPILGRAFTPQENEVPGRDAVVLIGHGLWQRRYGGDAAILGSTIRLNNNDYTIVGVMPQGFSGLSDAAEAWIPIAMHDVVHRQTARFDFLHTRDVRWLRVIGKLKNGTSLATARSEMETIGAELARAYPKENGERGVLVWSAADRMLGAFRTPMLILLGAVGFVLMIACANVANLVIARSAARGHEFALRAALGAGRGQLTRQLVVEGLLLSGIAAAVSLLVAQWGVHSLTAALPLSLPTFVRGQLDHRVLALTGLLAVATGTLLGVLPAIRAPRAMLNNALRSGGQSGARAPTRRLSGALVVSEVALALMLSIAAVLLIRSLDRLLHVPAGFQQERLVALKFYVPDRPAAAGGRNRFGPDLADFLATLPGVESAAVTDIDPFVWGGIQRAFTIEGRAAISNEEADGIYYQVCGPAYFRTMQIPMEAGREFTAQDAENRPLVVVVSHAFARRYWPAQSAIGKRLKFGPADSSQPWMEVVGVAGDIKFASLRQDPSVGVLYGPLLQSDAIISETAVVRAKGDPTTIIPTLREAIRQRAPDLPVASITTLEQRMRDSAAESRAYASLLGFFAALAIALAVIGVYGVISYWVTERTQEIGIRVALGAGRAQVASLVVRQGLRPIVLGVCLGVLGSVALTRLMSGLLYHTSPLDPVTFVAASGALGVVAVCACLVPTTRATRVDPIVALRRD